MKINNKILAFLFALIFTALNGYAIEPKVSVTLPENCKTGLSNKFYIAYTIKHIEDPNLDVKLDSTTTALEILYFGMRQMFMHSTTINGKEHKNHELTYTLLAYAKDPGTYVVPRLAIYNDGEEVVVNQPTRKITVKKDTSKINAEEITDTITRYSKVITSLSPEKDTYQIGDSIKLTIKFASNETAYIKKLYRNHRIFMLGCELIHIPVKNELAYDEDGANVCGLIEEYYIIPNKSGEYTIPSIKYRGTMKVWENCKRGKPKYRDKRFSIMSNEVKFRVEN